MAKKQKTVMERLLWVLYKLNARDKRLAFKYMDKKNAGDELSKQEWAIVYTLIEKAEKAPKPIVVEEIKRRWQEEKASGLASKKQQHYIEQLCLQQGIEVPALLTCTKDEADKLISKLAYNDGGDEEAWAVPTE